MIQIVQSVFIDSRVVLDTELLMQGMLWETAQENLIDTNLMARLLKVVIQSDFSFPVFILIV